MLTLLAFIPTLLQSTTAATPVDLEPAWHGTVVADAGDADLDGSTDILVGAYFEGSDDKRGRVRLFSGKTGKLLHTLQGEAGETLFGIAVAGGGDTDSDTAGDFIVGAPLEQAGGKSTGVVRVYSGRSGQLLRKIEGTGAGEWYGYAVNSAGDVDQDGVADLVAGGPQAACERGGACGVVRVFSGRTGSLVHEWRGDAPGDLFGCSVDNAGDTDGDGSTDIVVGAWGGDYVRWYSGRTGEILHEVRGTTKAGRFGWSVRRAGDTNQNGMGDVVVGIPGGLPEAARVYSGRDAKLLITIERPTKPGQEGWNYGIAVDGAGDVNGDGFDDLIVGDSGYPERIFDTTSRPMTPLLVRFREGLARKGVVRILSGNGGKELRRIEGDSNDDRFGVSVSAAGDVDQDGAADFVVGTGREATYLARIYSGRSGKVVHELKADEPKAPGKSKK